MTDTQKPKLKADKRVLSDSSEETRWIFLEGQRAGEIAFTDTETKEKHVRLYPNGLQIVRMPDPDDPEKKWEVFLDKSSEGQEDEEHISLRMRTKLERRTTGKLREKIEDMQKEGLLTFSKETQRLLNALDRKAKEDLSNGGQTFVVAVFDRRNLGGR